MDTAKIRDKFPITKAHLKHHEEGKDLIFMDHGASTHPPQEVLDVYLDMLQNKYANVHRAAHELSCISTDMFDEVPQKMANLFGINDLANSGMQAVMTTNTTSSLDLASHLFSHIEGKVLTTTLEHHSNDLTHRRRGEVEYVEVDERGMLIYEQFEEKMANHDVKLVAVSAGSNVTGYMPDVHRIARIAHDHDAKILVDAAQRTAHAEMQAKPLGHPEHLDFIAVGGHKMYAPFGASCLIGEVEHMNEAPPYIPGGGTVSFVSTHDAHYLDGPERHQPGTPNIAGSVAMGAAADFLMDVGLDSIRQHEIELLEVAEKRLKEVEGFEMLGDIPIEEKLGVISFNLDGLTHDVVSEELDRMAGIATRNGCFCAQPYVQRLLGISDERMEEYRRAFNAGETTYLPGAVRATIGIYNIMEEIEVFVDTVERISREHAILTH